MRPKKILCLIAACLVLLPQMVFAIGASDFKDVPSDHWGYGYIDFAAKSGIINGYLQSNQTYLFRPDQSVTKEESMKMIYESLSHSGRLASSLDFSEKYQAVLDTAGIAKWSRPCVSYGLEYGILKESELSGFCTSAGAGVAATREQVALWAAKASGRELLPAVSLAYKDAESISWEMTPYIELLRRLGIMEGDNHGNFNPKEGIRRVEFAAVCNRLYELPSKTYQIDQETVSFQGTLSSVNASAGTIRVTMQDGTARTLTMLDSSATIILNGEQTKNGLQSLPVGVPAIFSYGPFGQIHVDTAPLRSEGKVVGLESRDNANSALCLENEQGQEIYYFINWETPLIPKTGEGEMVRFLADGMEIIELLPLQ